MKDLLSAADLDARALKRLLDRAARWKAWKESGRRGSAPRPLASRSVGLWFELPSTRTRVALEVAVADLGGHPVFLRPDELQLSRGETVADTVRVLQGYLDAIAIRTADDARVREIARSVSIPVINALTPLDHPLQILADLAAIRERRRRLAGARIAFLGDGASNIARSLALVAPAAAIRLAIASPPAYRLPDAIVEGAGGAVRATDDPDDALRDAEFIYTDVWVSMGAEQEALARRIALAPYRLDAKRLAAAPPGALVMHCLPAHPGEEIDRDVLDGPRSIVIDQAHWRLHATKAVLEAFVAGSAPRRPARRPKGGAR